MAWRVHIICKRNSAERRLLPRMSQTSMSCYNSGLINITMRLCGQFKVWANIACSTVTRNSSLSQGNGAYRAKYDASSMLTCFSTLGQTKVSSWKKQVAAGLKKAPRSERRSEKADPELFVNRVIAVEQNTCQATPIKVYGTLLLSFVMLISSGHFRTV